MKVLHISKFYPPFHGGIEKVVYDTVEGLNDNNCDADVLCFNHGEDISLKKKYTIYRADVGFQLSGMPISLDYVKKIINTISSNDIVHIHMPNPIANIALLFADYRGKVVLHWHNDIIKQKYLLKLYKPFQSWLLNRADAIIATSPNYIEGSPAISGYKEKCHVIPIGISKGEVSSDINITKELKKKYDDRFVVFSLGRLSEYKGFQYLIDSANYLTDDVRILIGGTGPLREYLQEQIFKHDLDHKVKLLGRLPDESLGSYYEMCDAFCMSSISRNEGFGIVQLEAMLFEKPVITTDIPGSGITFGNIKDKTGLVVPPKNSEALARAIQTLKNNKTLRDRFAKNGKERATNLFTKTKMVNKTIDLYKNL